MAEMRRNPKLEEKIRDIDVLLKKQLKSLFKSVFFLHFWFFFPFFRGFREKKSVFFAASSRRARACLST